MLSRPTGGAVSGQRLATHVSDTGHNAGVSVLPNTQPVVAIGRRRKLGHAFCVVGRCCTLLAMTRRAELASFRSSTCPHDMIADEPHTGQHNDVVQAVWVMCCERKLSDMCWGLL